MDEREQFFYDHAGWSYDPACETSEQGRHRAARELAQAEREAQRRGWLVQTSPALDGPMPDDAGSVEAVESGEMVCLDVWLTAGDDADPEAASDVLAVLGNVIVPGESDPYVRVVGAELAFDVLAHGCTWAETRARSLR